MIVACALSLIIENAISSTYKEAEISYESEMWKEAMLEEMRILFIRKTLGNCQNCLRERPLAANRYIQRKGRIPRWSYY